MTSATSADDHRFAICSAGEGEEVAVVENLSSRIMYFS
jgi:hypothetical protein